MNAQEKYEVIKALVDSKEKGNKDRAALKLGVTRRQINRMISGYKKQGKAFFVHGNKGRKPATTIPDPVRSEIVDLYKTKYYDANFSHFTSLLAEHEGISISESSVRNILEESYIFSPHITKEKRKRIKKELKAKQKEAPSKEVVEIQKNIVAVEDAHSRKPRKAFFGEQLQLDAASYVWFGSDITHLHIAVDDCTGRIMAAWFDTQETLKGYYHLFHQVLTSYGIPYEFFTDRRTVFDYKRKDTSDLAEDTLTQFGYACKQLGVDLKCSSIPQAKSRVERMFKTLQSRLPVELRLAAITEIDAANEFLRSYINKYNAEFALPLDGTKSAFEMQPDEETINLTLAVLCNRVVDAGHCIQKDNVHYRMIDSRGSQVHYQRGTKTTVIQAFDGRMFCTVNDSTVLALEEIPQYEKESKSLLVVADTTADQEKPRRRNVYIPPMSHPWRHSTFNSFAKKQPHRIEMELNEQH